MIRKAVKRLSEKIMLKQLSELAEERPAGDDVSRLRKRGNWPMDNLTKREQPDRSKINMHEAFEVKYWTHALGVSKEELQRAVDKVGNSAATVRKELGV